MEVKQVIKQTVKIPVETIKKVVIWIWNNKEWIVPTVVSMYETIKGWFKKKPKKLNDK